MSTLWHLWLLRSLCLTKNEFFGSLPEQLLKGLALLSELHGNSNKLSGSLPSAIGQMSALTILHLESNQLEGSVPVLPSTLTVAQLQTNKLHGHLPETLSYIRNFVDFSFANNSLAGSVPEWPAGGSFKLLFGINYLAGSLPAGLLAGNSNIKKLALYSNLLRGGLPSAIQSMKRLETLYLNSNRFTGSLPVAPELLTCLMLSYNELSGTLPEGLGVLLSMKVVDLSVNILKGRIPDSIGFMVVLRYVFIHKNRLAGALPSNLAWLPFLTVLKLDANDFIGALPDAVCLSRQLGLLEAGDNALEGTMLGCFSDITSLSYLQLSGDGHRQALRGSLPSGIARATGLVAFVAPANRLEGFIPALSPSLKVFDLHRNALELLLGSRLSVKSEMYILLHRNRLSCKLPADNATRAAMVLVALGNHLTRLEEKDYPAWVLPIERDGLFWYDSNDGCWLAAKILIGCGALVSALLRRIEYQCLPGLCLRWQSSSEMHGVCARLAAGVFSFMASQVLRSSVLVSMVLTCTYYVCPHILALMSACLLRSLSVQILVIVLWGYFCMEVQRPFWISDVAGNCKAWTGQESRVALALALARVWALWLFWIIGVIVLSVFVIMNMAAKCIPSFLNLSGNSTYFLEVSMGLLPAIMNGALVPWLAKLISQQSWNEARKPSLICVASALSTFLIPSLVGLYLDGKCMDRWTLWWRACDNAHSFDVKVPLRGTATQVLHHRDICNPGTDLSISACVRSIALKLQEFLLNKLVATAFALPACRLRMYRDYTDTDQIVVKLAVCLELGMLLGPCLPLMLPLLCLWVLSEGLLAAVAWNKQRMKAGSQQGDVRLSVIMTGICSVMFYA